MSGIFFFFFLYFRVRERYLEIGGRKNHDADSRSGETSRLTRGAAWLKIKRRAAKYRVSASHDTGVALRRNMRGCANLDFSRFLIIVMRIIIYLGCTVIYNQVINLDIYSEKKNSEEYYLMISSEHFFSKFYTVFDIFLIYSLTQFVLLIIFWQICSLPHLHSMKNSRKFHSNKNKFKKSENINL